MCNTKTSKVISSARACSLCHAKNRPHDSTDRIPKAIKFDTKEGDQYSRLYSSDMIAMMEELRQKGWLASFGTKSLNKVPFCFI